MPWSGSENARNQQTVCANRPFTKKTVKSGRETQRFLKNFEEKGIQVLNGRFGPYVTDGTKNVKVPKDQEPKELSLEECIHMIENAPVKRGRFGAKKKVVSKKKVVKKKSTKKKAENT